MASPVTIDIPHRLGRAEAIRRMHARIGELPDHIPGGVAAMDVAWPAEDRMTLGITVLGQSVSATIDVGETVIRVSLLLPPLLAMMSGKIAEIVRRKGGTLLLDDGG